MPCSWIGRLDIEQMSILSKSISRFNTIKIPFRHWQADSELCVERQQTWERGELSPEVGRNVSPALTTLLIAVIL